MQSSGSPPFASAKKWGALSETDAGWNLVDVNGDGLPDIIYLNSVGKFIVLLNTGTAFKAESIWGTQVDNPWEGYALADVNGDGLPDIVYDSLDANGNYTGIMVLINTGSSFKPARKFGSRKYPFSSGTFLMADVNGDGLFDFVYDALVGTNHQIEVVPAGSTATILFDGVASDLMSSATNGIGGTY